jgi:hypothetical protein
MRANRYHASLACIQRHGNNEAAVLLYPSGELGGLSFSRPSAPFEVLSRPQHHHTLDALAVEVPEVAGGHADLKREAAGPVIRTRRFGASLRD